MVFKDGPIIYVPHETTEPFRNELESWAHRTVDEDGWRQLEKILNVSKLYAREIINVWLYGITM